VGALLSSTGSSFTSTFGDRTGSSLTGVVAGRTGSDFTVWGGGEFIAVGSSLGTSNDCSGSDFMFACVWFGLSVFWLGLTVLLGRRIFLRLLVVEFGDNIGVVIFELSLITLCTGDWTTLSVLGNANPLVTAGAVDTCRFCWITGCWALELSKLVLWAEFCGVGGSYEEGGCGVEGFWMETGVVGLG